MSDSRFTANAVHYDDRWPRIEPIVQLGIRAVARMNRRAATRLYVGWAKRQRNITWYLDGRRISGPEHAVTEQTKVSSLRKQDREGGSDG